jgi:hypothetical protein
VAYKKTFTRGYLDMKLFRSVSYAGVFALQTVLQISCKAQPPGQTANLAAHQATEASADSQTIEKKLKMCGSKLTLNQYHELLKLTDNSTFASYEEAAPRSKRIAEIFAEANDRRGIFASMYVAITNESVDSSRRGAYQNTELSKALVYRFAQRYFGPLHDYLLNKPLIKEWDIYYKLAEECTTSDLRVLGTGVNTHMTFDLPYTLWEIGAPASFEADFVKFGEILIERKKASTDLLRDQQNVYAADFFDGYWLGSAVNNLLGEGLSAKIGFRAIRAEAWHNGQVLSNSATRSLGEASIRSAWNVRQGVLRAVKNSQPPK